MAPYSLPIPEPQPGINTHLFLYDKLELSPISPTPPLLLLLNTFSQKSLTY